jgi:hypothetical protein
MMASLNPSCFSILIYSSQLLGFWEVGMSRIEGSKDNNRNQKNVGEKSKRMDATIQYSYHQWIIDEN